MITKSLLLSLSIFVALFASIFAFEQQKQIEFKVEEQHKRPFSVVDLLSMPRLGGLVLSPDGRLGVFSQSLYNISENKSVKHLWAMAIDSSDLTQITFGQVQDDQPVWVSDDEILFTRKVEGASSPSFYLLNLEDLDKGPVELTTSDLPYSIDNIKYSESGQFLAFTSEVYPDSVTLNDTLQKDKVKPDYSSARVFDKIYFRHWDQFDNHKNSHVFIVPFSAKNPVLDFDNARNLMTGLGHLSCPIPPFGGANEFVFNSDATEMIFASMKNFDQSVQAYSTETHIYRIKVDRSSKDQPECLSCDQGEGAKNNPGYSPNGKYISWTQMKVPQFEADKNNLVLMEIETGKKTILTAKWDRSVESYSWSLDSQVLYVIAQHHGRSKVYALYITSGIMTELTQEGVAANIQFVPNREILIFSQSTMMRPAEFFSVDSTSGLVIQKTRIYNKTLADVDMVQPEEFWFNGAKNEKVMGWFLKPANYDPSKKYPLAYLIHGGPQSSWMDSFSTRWNPEIFTGAGYAVAMVNFHGSTGYGQDFTNSISKNWGSYPYQDIMAGLDYVLKANPWIDQTRIAGLGASYGGYMINWLNGHTNRFTCLVNHDGLFDVKSMYYETEELYFPEHDNGGTPFDNPALYDKWNPSNFVANWKTPVLVIHGGKDYRVPEGQGFSTFTALQRKGIESKLLYFPDENHWVLKPANSLRWHQEVLQWIGKFTKSD